MNSIKNFLNIKIVLFLHLSIAFNLLACNDANPIHPIRTGQNPSATTRDRLSEPKNVIVLLHGIDFPNDPSIANLGKKLSQDIKNAEVIILDRYNSGIASTTQQAEETYLALKARMEQKNLTDAPVCMIGSSQGGLVALEIYRKYKDNLNVKGVITYHIPLEGAPGVNVSKEALSKLKHSLITILEHSGNPALIVAIPPLKVLDMKNI